jgi:hypothetical protein
LREVREDIQRWHDRFLPPAVLKEYERLFYGDPMTDPPNFCRPWDSRGSQTSIRFQPELIARVDAMAKRAGVTRTLVVNRMVEWALAQVTGPWEEQR